MATALCHTDSYTLSGKGDPLTEGDLFYPGTCLFNRPGHFLGLFSATQHDSRVQPRLKVQPAFVAPIWLDSSTFTSGLTLAYSKHCCRLPTMSVGSWMKISCLHDASQGNSIIYLCLWKSNANWAADLEEHFLAPLVTGRPAGWRGGARGMADMEAGITLPHCTLT